jgi:hypothetical protein
MEPITVELVLGAAGVPIIVALTEVVKVTWPRLGARWYPLVALGWGLALNLGVGWRSGTDPVVAIVSGLVAALAAAGLYSGGKAIAREPR